MRLIDNNTGKKQSVQNSTELMDENRFWEIIKKSNSLEN